MEDCAFLNKSVLFKRMTVYTGIFKCNTAQYSIQKTLLIVIKSVAERVNVQISPQAFMREGHFTYQLSNFKRRGEISLIKMFTPNL